METIVSTETAIIGITVVFMLAMLGYFWRMRRYAQSIASMVAVLGILGTFVGIVYGLYEFDPDDIEKSIPTLLGGLKIAFGTSIIGIFLSLVLKFRSACEWRQAEVASSQVTPEATIDDLADSLSRIHQSQKDEGKATRAGLQALERALTGDTESTVVTQLQKIRTGFLDKQDELIRSFNDFAEKMADNNSKALIQALEEVIKDFNAKINEQFGDNFKQLNQAMEKILDWQEQYRQQMDELARQFQITVESIEDSEESLRSIAAQSGRIGENAERLAPILEAIDERQKNLADHLAAFRDLSEKAREAFPIVESQLASLTKGFSDQVQQAVSLSTKSGENLRKTVGEQAGLLESIANDTRKNVESIMGRTGQSVETMFQDTSKRMEKQLSNLDEELEKELSKSLSSLGSQLTSLSAKFVEDYSPLTDKLREVVDIARSVQHA